MTRPLRIKLKHFSDVFIAVFNSNKSDVKKARAKVIGKFGMPGWKKVLSLYFDPYETYWKGNRRLRPHGIMAVFKHPICPESKLFIGEVALASDARRIAK